MEQYRRELKELINKNQKHQSRKAQNQHIYNIKQKRDRLHAQIEEFNQQAVAFMQSVTNTDQDSDGGDESSADEDDVEEAVLGANSSQGKRLHSESEDGEIEPESMVLHMPSTIKREGCVKGGIVRLMELEIQLRKAQANDHLSEIRQELGHK